MSPELVKVLKKVADELSAMPKEEFLKLLDDQEPGPISEALQDHSRILQQDSKSKFFYKVVIDLDWGMRGDRQRVTSYFLEKPDKQNIEDWALKNFPGLKFHFTQKHDIISIEKILFADEEMELKKTCFLF